MTRNSEILIDNENLYSKFYTNPIRFSGNDTKSNKFIDETIKELIPKR